MATPSKTIASDKRKISEVDPTLASTPGLASTTVQGPASTTVPGGPASTTAPGPASTTVSGPASTTATGPLTSTMMPGTSLYERSQRYQAGSLFQISGSAIQDAVEARAMQNLRNRLNVATVDVDEYHGRMRRDDLAHSHYSQLAPTWRDSDSEDV